MRLPLLISLSALLLLSWQRAGAQIAPADDFFHSGAQLYISNSIPQAKEVVEMGLKLYPDDEKLKKLEELLNQQQQQQQNQQQNQQQQQSQSQQNQQNQQNQQQQQNQQDQSQQNQSQPQQQQSKSDQDKQNQQQQQNQANQDKQDQQQQQNAGKDKSGNQDQQAQAVAAGRMTPEEAKKLLDAQKGDEQLLQWKPADKPRDTSKPIKDW